MTHFLARVALQRAFCDGERQREGRRADLFLLVTGAPLVPRATLGGFIYVSSSLSKYRPAPAAIDQTYLIIRRPARRRPRARAFVSLPPLPPSSSLPSFAVASFHFVAKLLAKNFGRDRVMRFLNATSFAREKSSTPEDTRRRFVASFRTRGEEKRRMNFLLSRLRSPRGEVC